MIFVAKFFETVGLVFLGAAIDGLPWAWVVCVACLVAAVGLTFVAMRRARKTRAQNFRKFKEQVDLAMAAHEHEDDGSDEDEDEDEHE